MNFTGGSGAVLGANVVLSNGVAVTSGNLPKYLDTTGLLIGDSGVNALTSFLPLAGGNMSGDIDMKGNNLKDVDLITYNSGHGLAIGDSNTSAVNNSIAIGTGAVNTIANSILMGGSTTTLIAPTLSGAVDLGDAARPFKRARFTGTIVAGGLGNESTASSNSTALVLGAGASNSTAHSVLMGDSSVVNIRPNNNVTCDLGTSSANFQWLYANSIVTNKQVITPADNTTVYPIDTTKDTILIDTSNFSAQVSLAVPSVNKKLTVSLLYQRGLSANVNISGISSSFGFLLLDSSTPGAILSYVDGTWYFLNYIYNLGSLLPKNQSTKLIPSGHTGTSGTFGFATFGCISLSNDGNTLVAGAPFDDDFKGSVYVWIQTAGVWTQQARLQPSDGIGNAQFGYSCCLSADGNTLCVGGPVDNSAIGALWMWTRSGTTWTQRQKLLPTGHGGAVADLGQACCMSSDGTYIFGGAPFDGGATPGAAKGAAFIYTKTAPNTWSLTQRVQGSGIDSTASFGSFAMRCSSDGKTILIGAWNDDSARGCVFVYQAVFDFSSWTQIGNKFLPAGTAANSGVGSTIALSADGSIAYIGSLDGGATGSIYMYSIVNGVPTLITSFTGNDTTDSLEGNSGITCTADGSYITSGGYGDSTNAGAMWQFNKTLNNNVFQYGAKILASSAIGAASFGYDVCTTPSGNVIAVYAPFDNTNVGAVFVFQ